MNPRIPLLICLGLTMTGCLGTPTSPNEIYYKNGTVYYLESQQAAHPAHLDGVTEVHLDRDYVTVQTHDGMHIIPRDRFIQSSPNSSGMATTTP